MLACVTATRPFYLVLELCEDNLLHILRAKAEALRQQQESEQAQMPPGKTVTCTDFARRFQNAQCTLAIV